MGYSAGDEFSYYSITQNYVVTWTRNDKGEWWADDGRDMPATDADVAAITPPHASSGPVK